MSNRLLDDILSRLENVSTEAVRITDPALNETPDSVAAFEKISERGVLVQQLQAELGAAGPLSYPDFNRLVVIHHQGSRAEENLRLTRNQLAGRLSVHTRERAYLDCITGGLNVPPATRLTNTA
jgi:hypothetical protein